VLAVFLTRYLVVVGPWIRVLAPDWSRVCFFGSMMCHGHVDSCVATRRHVAWCGSHRFHMISCAYLFSSELQSRQMIYPFQSSQRARCNGANCRTIRHLRLFMMMPYLCHWFTCSHLYYSMCISMSHTTKDGNTNTCVICQYKSLF
jgi:hypothetical protein